MQAANLSPGTISDLVVQYMLSLPRGYEVTTAELVDAVGGGGSRNMRPYLSPCIKAGIISMRVISGMNYWKLNPQYWLEFSDGYTPPARTEVAAKEIKLTPSLALAIGTPLYGSQNHESAYLSDWEDPHPAPPVASTFKTCKRYRGRPSFADMALAAKAGGGDSTPIKVIQAAAKARRARPSDKLELGEYEPYPEEKKGNRGRYASLFSQVSINGAPLKCDPEDVNRISNALRAFVLRSGVPANMFNVRYIRDAGKGDGLARIWLLGTDHYKPQALAA